MDNTLHTFYQQVIVTHGLCHLMGYTHKTHTNWTQVRHASSLEYVLGHRSCCLVCINLNSIPLCSLLQMYAKEASILTAYNSAFGEQLKPLTTNCGDSV